MSRQFSGRSSTSTSSCSDAAILPRDPWTTKIDGSSKPCAASQRWLCTCAVSPLGLGTAGEKDHFPAPFAREPRQPRQRAGLDLVERLPEILARARRIPQLALLAAGQRRHAEARAPPARCAAAMRRAPARSTVAGVPGSTPGNRRRASRASAPWRSATVPSRSKPSFMNIEDKGRSPNIRRQQPVYRRPLRAETLVSQRSQLSPVRHVMTRGAG